MVKLKFTLPKNKQKEILTTLGTKDGLQEIEKSLKATEEVQNYVISIGKFWTNKTAKTLRGYIAKELAGATSAEDFKKLIDSKAGKTLPAELKYLTLQQIQNALQNEYSPSEYLSTPKTIQKALLEYPLEALEISDDILSIFSRPTFKEKIAQKLYSSLLPEMTMEILERLNISRLSCGKLLDDGDLKAGQEKVIQLISDDIVKYLIIKSLDPDIKIKDIFLDRPQSLKKLKNINIKELYDKSSNTEEQENQILTSMKENLIQFSITNTDLDNFVKYLKLKLEPMTKESIKIADLIIDKTEAGLNWRYDAAKDVADMEAYSTGVTTTDEAWKFIADFWKKFNNGVKLYNAHAYKIGEFTDVAIPNTETAENFPNAGQLESKLIEQSGFTTQSNYSYLYDSIHRFFSAPAERNAAFNTNALDLILTKFEKGWNGVPGYLYSGNKNNIVYSHAAIGNHDKQRISQTFSMNMPLTFLNELDLINKYNNDSYWTNIGNGIREDLLASNLEYSEFYDDIRNCNWGNLFNNISSRNLAKIAAYNNAFAKAVKTQESELQKIFSKALDKLSSKQEKHSDFFFYKNFENTFEDILEIIPNEYKDKITSLKEEIHKELTAPAQIRGIEAAKLMVALPANPTVFAGDELLELGGEEKAKNVSVQNRNRLHWENLKYPHVSNYVENLSKIFNLRNDKQLSSLVNGDTILLNNQGRAGDRDLLGMYRYNDNDDCIILMHNAGFNSGRNFSQVKDVSIPRVNMSGGIINYAPDGSTERTATATVGLPADCKIKSGTKFVNALDEKEEFIIGDDGNLYAYGRNQINLTSSVTILKRA